MASLGPDANKAPRQKRGWLEAVQMAIVLLTLIILMCLKSLSIQGKSVPLFWVGFTFVAGPIALLLAYRLSRQRYRERRA